MADALDSKSSDRKIVWVQVPPPANLLYPIGIYAKRVCKIRDITNELPLDLPAGEEKMRDAVWRACEIQSSRILSSSL